MEGFSNSKCCETNCNSIAENIDFPTFLKRAEQKFSGNIKLYVPNYNEKLGSNRTRNKFFSIFLLNGSREMDKKPLEENYII